MIFVLILIKILNNKLKLNPSLNVQSISTSIKKVKSRVKSGAKSFTTTFDVK